MKLTLIILNSWHANIKNDWFGFSSRGGYAPSTLRILASLIPKDLNIEVEFFDENIERINFDTINSDIVGISVLTANAPRAYQIADKLRLRGIIVVLGGYHVSVMPTEALAHADSVVVGFAEKSFPLLLKDFAMGQMKSIYNESFEDSFTNHIPIANNPSNYSSRYILPHSIEASRGCYNNCNFCVIPTFNKQYTQKPIENVIAEIKALKSKRIVFFDFSPFEDYDYAMELFQSLEPLNIKWYSCLSTRVAENTELIDAAAKSGCSGVLIGFESINSNALASGNKMINKPSNYRSIVSNLRANKIFVLGSFIFGFDEDTKNIFEETLDFIEDSQIDLLHYAILTPFPGTKLFEKLKEENRILTYDWSKYDGTRVVYQPARMTIEELQKGYFHIYEKSHSIPSILRRIKSSNSNTVVKLATNLGFRHYIKSFIKQYNNEQNYIR